MRKCAKSAAPSLAAAEARIAFPLLTVPSLTKVREIETQYSAAAEKAEQTGAGAAEHLGLLYHAKWARQLAEDLELGLVPSEVEGPINAVRIGDGLIVTGPGEVFTEIGMAVKERAPGSPTMYCGYTNGAVSYFPTAEAYEEGGYEPAVSNRTYGLPAQVDPVCASLLVERGVRLAERLCAGGVVVVGRLEAWARRSARLEVVAGRRGCGSFVLPGVALGCVSGQKDVPWLVRLSFT